MEREEEREWGQWEGVGRRGKIGNFYILIKKMNKKRESIYFRICFPGRRHCHVDSGVPPQLTGRQGSLQVRFFFSVENK